MISSSVMHSKNVLNAHLQVDFLLDTLAGNPQTCQQIMLTSIREMKCENLVLFSGLYKTKKYRRNKKAIDFKIVF